MSGGEPSSIKQFSRCAAGQPVPSRRQAGAYEFCFDFRVYGLILRDIFTLKIKLYIKLYRKAC